MVKDSQQVHGVIQILLPQRASKRTVVENMGTLQAFVYKSGKSGGGGSFYLSALMVRTSVSLLYRSPTSLIIFLRAWSSRFRLDSFTCQHNTVGHMHTKKNSSGLGYVWCYVFNQMKPHCKLFYDIQSSERLSNTELFTDDLRASIAAKNNL